jgi:acyl carrier protein
MGPDGGVRQTLRQILEDVGRLDVAGGPAATDLRAAGLTSLAAARVVVAIEDRFGFRFADDALDGGLFASLDTLEAAVAAALADA